MYPQINGKLKTKKKHIHRTKCMSRGSKSEITENSKEERENKRKELEVSETAPQSG